MSVRLPSPIRFSTETAPRWPSMTSLEDKVQRRLEKRQQRQREERGLQEQQCPEPQVALEERNDDPLPKREQSAAGVNLSKASDETVSNSSARVMSACFQLPSESIGTEAPSSKNAPTVAMKHVRPS